VRDNAQVTCPLCGKRAARRACPALGQEICAVCCATKRLAEIACPPSCRYLAASREHPAAAVQRQRATDVSRLAHALHDLNDRQGRLFVLLNRLVGAYEPTDFQSLRDEDVADAAGAVAATLETASRGVLYEQRPGSVPARRLAEVFTAAVGQAGSGSAFEREAAVVLRTIERLARGPREADPSAAAGGSWLAVVRRTLTTVQAPEEDPPGGPPPDAPRLILP
jgi:hypothetical protein